MKPTPFSHAGFSLVEVTMALGVASFCLLVILGMLPVGVHSNQTSTRQTVAASLARGIISDLRTTSKSAASSTIYGISIPTPVLGTTLYLKQDGTQVATPTGDEYCATVFVTAPDASQKTAMFVRLLVTWPAVASVFPRTYTGSYEVATAMDRN